MQRRLHRTSTLSTAGATSGWRGGIAQRPVARHAAALLASLFAACASSGTGPAPTVAEDPPISITGTLGLRDDSTLPVGIARVTVTDFAAGEDAPIIAESWVELDASRGMIPFEVSVPRASLEAGGQYVVRATVRDAEGVVSWTTGVAQMIDPEKTRSDVGVVMLVRPRHAAEDD